MERSPGLEQRKMKQKGKGMLGLNIQANMNVYFAHVLIPSNNDTYMPLRTSQK